MKILVLSRRINLLEEFSTQSWNHALLLTYTHDLVFFEREILRKLRENGCKNICLFVDTAAHRDTFQFRNSIKSIGKDYVVQTVSAGLVFHPKVYILVNENECKIIVGSGNLTIPGFCTNKEIFSCHSASDVTSVFYDYESIYSFLEDLVFCTELRGETQVSISMIMEALKSLLQRRPLSEISTESACFFNNISTPIIDQIYAKLSNDIQALTVLSPYFDTDNRIVDFIYAEKGIENIKIITQNRYSNFDVKSFIELSKAYNLVYELKQIEFNKDAIVRNHAKFIVFHTIEADYIVWGSANFTTAALLKTAKNGNLETVMLRKLKKGEWENLILGGDVSLIDINPDQFIHIPSPGYNHVSETQITLLDVTITTNSLIAVVKVTCDTTYFTLMINNKDIFELTETDRKNFNTSMQITLEIEEFHYAALPAYVYVQCASEQKVLASNTLWLNDAASLEKARLDQETYNKRGMLKNPNFSSRDYILKILTLIFTELKLDDKDLPAMPQKVPITPQNLEDREEIKDSSYYIEDDETQYDDWTFTLSNYDNLGLLNYYINAIYSELGLIEAATIKQAQSAQRHQVIQVVLNTGDRDIIRERFRAFMKKYMRGITSEPYIYRVTPDVIFFNYKIMVSSLSQLVTRLDQDNNPLIEPSFLLNEYRELHTKLTQVLRVVILSDSDKVILIQDILPVIVAEQLADYFIKQKEGQMEQVMLSKKAIQHRLQKLDKEVVRIKPAIDDLFLSRVALHSKLFGWDENKLDDSVRQLLEESFEDLMLVELGQRISKIRGVDGLRIEPSVIPRVIIQTNAEKDHLNWVIVQTLHWMLNVEEWTTQSIFTIVIQIEDLKRPCHRQVIRYEVDKRLICRSFYRKGSELWATNDRIDNSKVKSCYQRMETDIVKDYNDYKNITDVQIVKEMA